MTLPTVVLIVAGVACLLAVACALIAGYDGDNRHRRDRRP